MIARARIRDVIMTMLMRLGEILVGAVSPLIVQNLGARVGRGGSN